MPISSRLKTGPRRLHAFLLNIVAASELHFAVCVFTTCASNGAVSEQTLGLGFPVFILLGFIPEPELGAGPI